MKLTGKISWLIGRVKKSLVPHLNQCLTTQFLIYRDIFYLSLTGTSNRFSLT